MESSEDFWKTYEQLSQRLKKKYLKKSHFSESLDHFTKLAKHLDEEKCPQYAAFCALAVAKCEQSVGNSLSEAKAYSEAADYFMRAHLDSGQLNYEEHLSAALQAYSASVKIYCEHQQFCIAGSILLEAADKLKQAKKPDEAIAFYQRANEMNQDLVTSFMTGMDGLIFCLLSSKEFLEALNTVAAYQQYLLSCSDTTLEPFKSAYGRCKIHTILLMTLTHEAVLKRSENETKLWETFQSVQFTNPLTEIPAPVFFAIQSILLSIQLKDKEAFHLAINSCYRFWNPTERLIHENINSHIFDNAT